MEQLIETLRTQRDLSDKELIALITRESDDKDLFAAADAVRREHLGTVVFLGGVFEFTFVCQYDCYYCGIRKSNAQAQRYRLTQERILHSCENGYRMGFRTFVLQGGEDPRNTDAWVCSMVDKIKTAHPDCAVTLSIGEQSRASYQAYFDAGADRYLLRHETASEAHYRKLHPEEMSLANRKRCLFDLKDIGYQVGAGFMVGSPWQTPKELVADLRFLQQLQPDMIGIGPFIPHHETPFADKQPGTLELTLRMLSILRLLFPYVLLPATTALGTLDPLGREKGLKAGANVLMPNLSPVTVRKKYELYDNKICTGDESAQCRNCLEKRVENAGYHIVTDRGDVRR